MLFSPPVDARHESEKERNLYAKFLVGYWFNELVPKVEARVEAFCEVLESGQWFGGHSAVRLDARTTRLTLDYHAYRAGDGSDRGECADVLLVDTGSSSMVAMEAKLKTDFRYEKDVRANAERIERVSSQLGLRSVQCLLLTKRKRDEAERQDKNRHPRSQWALLRKHSGPPVVLVLWEQLATHRCVDPRVSEFVLSRLKEAAS